MNKAFTSEENEDEELPEAPSLPPNTKNYITLMGADRLQSEVDRLSRERKALADDIAGQARQKEIDRRLRSLAPRLERIEVIDPLQQPKDRILFGATVEAVDASGQRQTLRIVGLDEVDLSRGWISWMSPLANVLLEKKVGEDVHFQGRSLRIQSILYEA